MIVCGLFPVSKNWFGLKLDHTPMLTNRRFPSSFLDTWKTFQPKTAHVLLWVISKICFLFDFLALKNCIGCLIIKESTVDEVKYIIEKHQRPSCLYAIRKSHSSEWIQSVGSFRNLCLIEQNYHLVILRSKFISDNTNTRNQDTKQY